MIAAWSEGGSTVVVDGHRHLRWRVAPLMLSTLQKKPIQNRSSPAHSRFKRNVFRRSREERALQCRYRTSSRLYLRQLLRLQRKVWRRAAATSLLFNPLSSELCDIPTEGWSIAETHTIPPYMPQRRWHTWVYTSQRRCHGDKIWGWMGWRWRSDESSEHAQGEKMAGHNHHGTLLHVRDMYFVTVYYDL